MNIIYPVDDNGMQVSLADKLNNSIFLAGPCPRKDYQDDWRFEAFKILEDLGFNGNVITPTNPNYNKLEADKALDIQTQWEYEAMHNATAVVFWIPRSEKHPARTTNIEFGEFHTHTNVFVGWPDYAIHNEYLDVRLKMAHRPRWDNLKDLLKITVNFVNPAVRDFVFKSVIPRQCNDKEATAIRCIEKTNDNVSNFNLNIKTHNIDDNEWLTDFKNIDKHIIDKFLEVKSNIIKLTSSVIPNLYNLLTQILKNANTISLLTKRGSANVLIVNKKFKEILNTTPFSTSNDSIKTGINNCPMFLKNENGELMLCNVIKIIEYEFNSDKPAAILTYLGGGKYDGGIVYVENTYHDKYMICNDIPGVDNYIITFIIDE